MVIGPNGDNLGKMSSRAANELAVSYGLDLFCVAPNGNPPVCKILNYGKYRFEKQKSDRAQKENCKYATLKVVQLHISIGAHDLATKAKHAKAILADGDKVNERVDLEGREMAHQEIGEELLKKFVALMEEDGPLTTEKAPAWEGKCYSAILTSKSKK